ncbi:MAG: DNA-binding transcriptional regulator [Verrucomicrobia bacterium]|nr:DNA-binding transcriptional regulator [Verrucomicrobiota bacterium]
MPAARRKSYRRVAICVDRAQGYGTTILRGIARYVETYGPWSLFIDPRFNGELSQGWMREWAGDGVLAYVEDVRLADTLRHSEIPVVEVFGHRHDLGLPQVCTDNRAIGRLGAEHLIERKFRHFSFFGYRGLPWSELRLQGFAETLKNAGFECHVHLLPRHLGVLTQWNKVQQQMGDWLVKLPRPNGIMACSDRHAQRIIDACSRENISVPEEMAVVGAGNDEDLCRLTNPPLTSVIYDIERIGYEAAQLLDQIMRGNRAAAKPKCMLIPPLGIAMRRSTEVTAIDDRMIADAMRFIREHACDGITVEEILAEFNISKTHFYRRFQNALGRSPHEEILRVKLERARSLLTQTDLAIERIAELSGFEHSEYLYPVFKRVFGMTPRAFRTRKPPG